MTGGGEGKFRAVMDKLAQGRPPVSLAPGAPNKIGDLVYHPEDTDEMWTPDDISVDGMADLFHDLPEDGHIPGLVADVLRVRFWQWKSYLTDMKVKVQRYIQDFRHRATQRFEYMRSLSEEKSEAAKEREANADEAYQQLVFSRRMAEAILHWIEDKRQDLGEAHHLCRQICSEAQQEQLTEPGTGRGD